MFTVKKILFHLFKLMLSSFFFFKLTPLAKISSTMLNRSGESGHAWFLILSFTAKHSVSYTFSVDNVTI